MKKLIQLLFAGLFASLLATACALDSAEVSDLQADEPVAQLEQAVLGPCHIDLITNPPPVAISNYLLFTLTFRNTGTVGCPFKLAVDVFTSPYSPPGIFWNSSPIKQAGFLQPGQESTLAVRVTNVWAPCFYRVHQKFKPNYPSGSEQWYVTPAPPNDVYWC